MLSGALIEVMTLLTDAVAAAVKMLSVTMDLPLLLVVLNGTLISATGTVRTDRLPWAFVLVTTADPLLCDFEEELGDTLAEVSPGEPCHCMVACAFSIADCSPETVPC